MKSSPIRSLNLGPFTIMRTTMPTTPAAPAYNCYHLVLQLSSRTSLQLMLVRFDRAEFDRAEGAAR